MFESLRGLNIPLPPPLDFYDSTKKDLIQRRIYLVNCWLLMIFQRLVDPTSQILAEVEHLIIIICIKVRSNLPSTRSALARRRGGVRFESRLNTVS